MPEASRTTLSVCLVSKSAVLESTVRMICATPHRVQRFDLGDLVTETAAPSGNAQAIVEQASRSDVVLVEWNLDQAPEINTLCFHIRKLLTCPVVAVCPGGPDDVVGGLAAGADAALTFPFTVGQLQAMVLAWHRLVNAARTEHPPPVSRNVVTHGRLLLDLTAHRFTIDGAEVELTPREFALLTYLMERPDTVCTREDIQDVVWGIQFDTGTNMVDVYMYFLRRKLAAHGVTDVITTIRGHGYRLDSPS